MKRVFASIGILSTLALIGCSAQPDKPLAQITKTASGEVVTVNQPHQSDSMNGFWNYMMFSHMMNGGFGGGSTVNHIYTPSYHSTYTPSYHPSYTPSYKSYTPSYRPSYSGYRGATFRGR